MPIVEPFDGGPFMQEAGWSLLFASMALNGVVGNTALDMQVYTDADGRQVKVRPGSFVIRGHRYTDDTTATVPVPQNSSGAQRRDIVVMRLDTAQRTMSIVVLPGTPGTGTWPTLTRQPSGVWEEPLALLILDSGFTTVTSDKLIDARPYTGPIVPAGEVRYIAGSTAPLGWLVASGGVYYRAQYPALFAAVGTSQTEVGVASDRFGLRDLRGRMPIGAGGAYGLGSQGGAAATDLSANNIPALEPSVDGDSGARVIVTASPSTYYIPSGTAPGGAVQVSISDIDLNTPGDPFTTISPYTALTPIIKAH